MNTLQREFIKTADGSSSIYVPDLDESYHSRHGAIAESEYVFLKQALDIHKSQNISIFEVGFGTGLNAILTLRRNKLLHKNINYHSIERYPLTGFEISQLNYSDFFNTDEIMYFNTMHKCESNMPIAITDNFLFTKIIDDFKNFKFNQTYDIIYFDAFAPNKQSELWTTEIFSKIYNACNNDAIFTTYCAKGDVRRSLQSVGFIVERIPGPPGKNQMLHAKKTTL